MEKAHCEISSLARKDFRGVYRGHYEVGTEDGMWIVESLVRTLKYMVMVNPK